MKFLFNWLPERKPSNQEQVEQIGLGQSKVTLSPDSISITDAKQSVGDKEMAKRQTENCATSNVLKRKGSKISQRGRDKSAKTSGKEDEKVPPEKKARTEQDSIIDPILYRSNETASLIKSNPENFADKIMSIFDANHQITPDDIGFLCGLGNAFGVLLGDIQTLANSGEYKKAKQELVALSNAKDIFVHLIGENPVKEGLSLDTIQKLRENVEFIVKISSEAVEMSSEADKSIVFNETASRDFFQKFESELCSIRKKGTASGKNNDCFFDSIYQALGSPTTKEKFIEAIGKDAYAILKRPTSRENFIKQLRNFVDPDQQNNDWMASEEHIQKVAHLLGRPIVLISEQIRDDKEWSWMVKVHGTGDPKGGSEPSGGCDLVITAKDIADKCTVLETMIGSETHERLQGGLPSELEPQARSLAAIFGFDCEDADCLSVEFANIKSSSVTKSLFEDKNVIALHLNGSVHSRHTKDEKTGKIVTATTWTGHFVPYLLPVVVS